MGIIKDFGYVRTWWIGVVSLSGIQEDLHWLPISSPPQAIIGGIDANSLLSHTLEAKEILL